ncbi:hypothetical protein MMC20_000331 [Loxospora ochrophaea]|nr:hypothetical protein [Loxospora ochrophaea]
MAEEQAIDRVHRMGQEQEVRAIRYVVRNSIEEYVASVQNKKIELFQQSFGAHGPSKAEMIRERLKDLKGFLE